MVVLCVPRVCLCVCVRVRVRVCGGVWGAACDLHCVLYLVSAVCVCMCMCVSVCVIGASAFTIAYLRKRLPKLHTYWSQYT